MTAAPAPTLDGLIREVDAAAPNDPLTQLERASATAQDLADLGDALLTHFVDRCRRNGHTWAEIGAHLGVTRQAAQKRFVDSIGDTVTFERFTILSRETLDDASTIANRLGHNYVGTEHQLLAILERGDGVAFKVLDGLGVKKADAESALLTWTPKGPKPTEGPQPFTARARKVLEEAVNVSAELGHNYIGTEHLLLGLYRGQNGLAGRILADLGADRNVVKAKVVETLTGYTPPPRS